ncbi:trafficking regulator of GLUT4 1-like [Dreissena polymorpha]|uniref:Uncharacterized protein n=1 Tax=Dreissena polymorpha TaxID=45954 RepID=A0A9D4KAK4_DREPO|nr:trafficking regulator of GLUT4 1-like [Dreissena polymorpha]KAH3836028.1 hypothetical protein DPMN_109397 [Dreissena polymorpha]
MDKADQQYPPAYNQQAVNYGQPQGQGGYIQQAGYIQPGDFIQQGFVAAPGQVVVLAQPQPTAVIVATGSRPPDYLVPSFFACLCCFWPTGAFALYFSNESKKAFEDGDMTNANRYSVLARNLMISSIVIGLIWIIALSVGVALNYSTSRHCTGYYC